jgi:hypothetical protein
MRTGSIPVPHTLFRLPAKVRQFKKRLSAFLTVPPNSYSFGCRVNRFGITFFTGETGNVNQGNVGAGKHSITTKQTGNPLVKL